MNVKWTHNEDSEPIIKTLSEVEELSEDAKRAVETAYRRGFCQGVWASIEAFQKGIPLHRIEKWYDRLVLRWRHTKHNGKIKFPEWLSRR